MIRDLIAMMVAAVLTVTTTGCAAPAELTWYPKARAASAPSRVGRIRAELHLVRTFAGIFTALLPVDQRRRLERLADQVDAALAIAEAASTLDRAAATRRAQQALADYRFAAGA